MGAYNRSNNKLRAHVVEVVFHLYALGAGYVFRRGGGGGGGDFPAVYLIDNSLKCAVVTSHNCNCNTASYFIMSNERHIRSKESCLNKGLTPLPLTH